jgi:hypothetical protein
MKKCILLFFVCLLSACTGNGTTSQPTGTATRPAASPTDTPILVTPTRTPRPTKIPTIHPTLTRTPERPQSAYVLPAWMGDPDTVILTTTFKYKINNETTVKIRFINASSGEMVDISRPSEVRGCFWFDNLHFGFLSNEYNFIYLIDTTNGEVSTSKITPQATRLLDKSSNHEFLVIRPDPLSPGGIMFLRADPYKFLNENRRYSASLDDGEQGSPVTVTDRETGNIVWQSTNDGLWDFNFEWSPARDDYLAVVGSLTRVDPYDNFLPTTSSLRVINVETGEVLAYHTGSIGTLRWSSDGTQILYLNIQSLYWNFGFPYLGDPCIYNLLTGESKCLKMILYHPRPEGYQLVTTGQYQWNPDGKSIYFVYVFGSEEKMQASLCNYDLLTGNITCPTDSLVAEIEKNVDWENGWNVQTPDPSPDGQFIYFCVSSNHPLSDDQAGPSRDALTTRTGTGFITWVSQIYQCSSSHIWRPFP